MPVKIHSPAHIPPIQNKSEKIESPQSGITQIFKRAVNNALSSTSDFFNNVRIQLLKISSQITKTISNIFSSTIFSNNASHEERALSDRNHIRWSEKIQAELMNRVGEPDLKHVEAAYERILEEHSDWMPLIDWEKEHADASREEVMKALQKMLVRSGCFGVSQSIIALLNQGIEYDEIPERLDVKTIYYHQLMHAMAVPSKNGFIEAAGMKIHSAAGEFMGLQVGASQQEEVNGIKKDLIILSELYKDQMEQFYDPHFPNEYLKNVHAIVLKPGEDVIDLSPLVRDLEQKLRTGKGVVGTVQIPNHVFTYFSNKRTGEFRLCDTSSAKTGFYRFDNLSDFVAGVKENLLRYKKINENREKDYEVKFNIGLIKA